MPDKPEVSAGVCDGETLGVIDIKVGEGLIGWDFVKVYCMSEDWELEYFPMKYPIVPNRNAEIRVINNISKIRVNEKCFERNCGSLIGGVFWFTDWEGWAVFGSIPILFHNWLF